MTRLSKALHQPITDLASAAAASLSDVLRTDQGGTDELSMTLSQIRTLFAGALGSVSATNINTSSLTISSLLTVANTSADNISVSSLTVNTKMTSPILSANDINTSSLTVSILTSALSAMTFTTTGQTSGVIAAITSGVNYGTATKGQFEFLIETVKDLKANMDRLIN